MKKQYEIPKKSESVPLSDEIMASVGCGIFAYSIPDRHIISLNRRAKELTGISEDGDFNTFIEEKVCSEYREELRCAVDSLKAPGDSVTLTFKIDSHNCAVYIKTKIDYLSLSDGSCCLLYTMTDVTEQARLIDTLVRDRINYREALTNGSEYSFSFDLTEGVIRERFTAENNIDLLKILGLSVPVSYDEMCRKYIRSFKLEFIEPEMARYFTCRGLLEVYESGRRNVVAEYFSTKLNTCIRAKYTMYHECETGHVYALVVASNTTSIRLKEKEQSEALKEAFDKLNRANDQMNITLEAVLDGISGGVRIIDAESYKYVSISEGAARLQGYTVSEFIEKFGGNVSDNIYPPDRKTAAAEAISQSNEQGVYNVKYRIQDRRGNIKWVIDRGKLVVNPSGKRLFYSVMQDVTELENRNMRLNDILEMQEKMADSLATGIFAYTLPHRKVLILNQAVREMFGYRGPNPELFGHTIMDRVSEEDRSAVIKAVKSLKKVGDTVEYTFHSKRADGSRITVRNSTKLLSFRDGQRFILSAMVDVTQQENDVRRLEEKHLRPHEEIISEDGLFSKNVIRYSRDIAESLGQIFSDIYYISLKERRCVPVKQSVDISDRFHEQGDLGSFLGLYCSEYVLPEDAEDFKRFFSIDTLMERLKNLNSINIEYRRKNFGWCRGLLIASDRDKKGNVTAVVFAVCIIDNEKREELALQESLRSDYESAKLANAAKTSFLADLSHDIRTPMNAIAGMTALAEIHIDDKERVADCLSKIKGFSKLLLGFVNGILDMSNIESGRLELNEEFFNLPELIDNLITMSKPELAEKEHELSVSVHSIEHENVVGDIQRIQQVFMNLMSNAIRYTPDGGKICLTVSEKPTDRQSVGCYEFVFRDNGIGMSEEFISRIFEPFARASSDSRIENIRGAGLGMSITKNIVKMMNGDIKVESKLNEGTCVTVTVFLKIENNSFSAYDNRFSGLRVLIADDDEIHCTSACEILSELGMICEWVTDGGAAIEKTLERHSVGDDYFAVILSRKMSEFSGIEAAKEICRRVGSKKPVIILSAFDRSDIEAEARSAGVNAFISKPMFKSRVIHLFNELIGNHESVKSRKSLCSYVSEDFSSKRALLVEDNDVNAEIAGEILSLAGLKVEYAVNGKEALDKIADAEDDFYNIVFMDIQMPVMNGYEATKAIRSLPGRYPKRVPIIAMTADVFEEDVYAAKNAGMNEHIAKPIDFDRLLEILKKWLDSE